jgi:DNA end-binding protein Ku
VEELVDTSEFTFPTMKDVRKPELQMARTLVENLADKWDPSQFTDEYRANLMKIIKAKMKGKEAHLQAPEEPQQAEVVDLMERLRQSLQGGRAGSAERSRHPGSAERSRRAGSAKGARRPSTRKSSARGTKRKRAA